MIFSGQIMKLALPIALMILAAHSTALGQADFTNGLAAHWQAEGDAKDTAGRWHGQRQDASFGPGVVGAQAFHFLNPHRSAVLIDAAALNEGFAALSILAWVNAERHGHSDYDGYGRTILSRTEGGGFALRVMDGQVQFDLRMEDGRVQKLLFAGAKVPLHRWTHLAAVYDGSAARVYVDGVAAGGAQAVSGRILRTTRPGARLVIGNEPGSTPQVPGPVQFGNFGWMGLIDDVRFYDRALDGEAVLACYAVTRPAVVDTPPKPAPPVPFKATLAMQIRRAYYLWCDPVLFALMLWPLALLTGARVWRALAACAGISAGFWCLAKIAGSGFIFHPGSTDSMLFSFGLVAAGYFLWRWWRRRVRSKTTEEPGLPPGFLAGRVKAMLLGAVASCLAAFPAAFVIALVWRLPIPFGRYESGVYAAGKSWFAVLFYGAIGGFLVLGFLGAIGGTIAHQRHSHECSAALRLNLLLALLFSTLGVGLLSGLDLLIGKW